MRWRGALRRGGGRVRRTLLGNRRAPVPTEEARILFAVSGGGPLWSTVGRRFFAENAAFRDAVTSTDERVRDAFGFSPVESYRAEWKASSWDETRQANIVNMGLMLLGICDYLNALGVRPAGAMGVSLGEPVAAHLAGALSREDVLTVILALARRVGHEPRDCLRVTVAVDIPTATTLCRLAPAPIDLMGEGARGDALLLCEDAHGPAILDFLKPYNILTVHKAKGWYHVRDVPFEYDGFVTDLAQVSAGTPGIPFYSSAYGGRVEEAIFDADFWRRAGSAAFYFGEAFANAVDDGFDVAIEVGSDLIHGWMNETVARSGAAMRVVSWIDWEAGFARSFPRPPAPSPVPSADPARVRFDPESGAWQVTGHAAAQSVLGDAIRYSSAPYRALDPVLLGSDPPEHARYRGVIAREMGPRVMTRVEARAIEVARARAVPPFDAVAEFARPIARAAGAALVDFSTEALRAIELGECQLDAARAAFPDHLALIDGFAAGAGLYAGLRARDVDDEAARSLVRVVWFASTATTERAIARVIQRLVDDPDLQERVAAEPALLPRLVEEVLRLHLPAPTLERVSTGETVLEGMTIPAGAMLRIDLEAANRDPNVFDDPDTLRLDRDGRASLVFGSGVHACIGAALARRVIPQVVAILLEGRRVDLAQSRSSRFLTMDRTAGPVRLSIEAKPR